MSRPSVVERTAVAITGLGVVSGLGVGREALWQAVEAGRDGMRAIVRFPTDPFSVHLAATVPEWERTIGDHRLHVRFGVTAALEALQHAGLAAGSVPEAQVGLVVGTGIVHEGFAPFQLTEAIGDQLGCRGPRITVSTACASSTNALGAAADLLSSGSADTVVAGGVDVITDRMFAGFHAIGALSETKCAPFSHPMGTTLGEGAGFVVLERESSAYERGAEVLCHLLGYGLSADGHAATSPHPKGAGVARAVSAALADAGVQPNDVGYVNAHGTGTPANDPAECLGLAQVFGERIGSLPVSATKSIVGHAQGAAGVLEAIVTILAMRRQLLPQTLNFVGARPRVLVDPVGQKHPRPHRYRVAVSTSSAFGGANAAVVLSLSHACEVAQRQLRDVYVAGAGIVGAHGFEIADLVCAASDRRRLGTRIPAYNLRRLVPTASTRTLDASSCHLAAAAALALNDAGITLRGPLRARSGLVLGVNEVSPESGRELLDSIDHRGLARLSTRAFTRLILNGPAGACSRLLQLLGPHSTLSTGRSSGLVATVYAAQLLASRGDADLMLAAGLREHNPDEDGPSDGEAAACLVLSSRAQLGECQRVVRLAGWGLAGPSDAAEAIRRALEGAGISIGDVDAVFGIDEPGVLEPFGSVDLPYTNPVSALGQIGAAGGAVAAALGFEAVRTGDSNVVLVTATEGQSAASALVFVGEAGAPGEVRSSVSHPPSRKEAHYP